jgi:hypothetical protein
LATLPLLPLAQTTEAVGIERPLSETFCPCSTTTTVWEKILLKEKQDRQMINKLLMYKIYRFSKKLVELQ